MENSPPEDTTTATITAFVTAGTQTIARTSASIHPTKTHVPTSLKPIAKDSSFGSRPYRGLTDIATRKEP
jgi:hypothetical protein